jgi:methylenetetrahydrofolate reductase (NADPH)
MIQRLRSEGGVNGFHFCTLNLEKSTQRILETLDWAGIPSVLNKLIVVRMIIFKENYYYMLIIKFKETPPVGTPTGPVPGDSTLLITPTNATATATTTLSTISTTEGEAGRGELNNAATWDDFPNGRFGDFKSPAFGDQDPRGGSSISVR